MPLTDDHEVQCPHTPSVSISLDSGDSSALDLRVVNRRNPAPAPSLENFKESEVQLSTGSCPGERLLKELDACSRSSLRPNGVSRRGSELNEVSQQPTRAIKVVPHNRRSATKSAARIFRSIQEERRLHE
ncbi:hypothetical protein CRG98_007115 [Punica granatum]|uniref:Uncharacterized protein n=1 Tax=Punica granatum TaxID=22663 RepID=A0A2I0KVL3_PUNGR|nr:hypothetical protein CRG98_007115 [Punica granatum]